MRGNPAAAVVALAWCLSAVHAGEPAAVRLGEGDLLRGVPGEGPLTLGQLRLWLDEPRNHQSLKPLLPTGLDGAAADAEGLEENPLTRAKIELGRQLYFDKRLSADGSVSCASCHDPAHGYATADPVAVGVRGRRGGRNSPTVLNRLLSAAQFWDGRASSLEEQALGPIANPIEMGGTHEACEAGLRRVPGYELQFRRVFDEGPTVVNAARAIAAFERVIVTGASPWDIDQRLRRVERAIALDEGDPPADSPEFAERRRLRAAAAAAPLSAAARRGAELFFGPRAGCAQCHVGANFSDEAYHNLGVGLAPAAGLRRGEPVPESLESSLDWGRYEITGDDADRGAFKTPTLRNIAQTGPYMHDGSQGSLEEVVSFYAAGGEENPWLSERIAPLDLGDSEQADLVAFLRALTGPTPPIETGRLPE